MTARPILSELLASAGRIAVMVAIGAPLALFMALFDGGEERCARIYASGMVRPALVAAPAFAKPWNPEHLPRFSIVKAEYSDATLVIDRTGASPLITRRKDGAFRVHVDPRWYAPIGSEQRPIVITIRVVTKGGV